MNRTPHSSIRQLASTLAAPRGVGLLRRAALVPLLGAFACSTDDGGGPGMGSGEAVATPGGEASGAGGDGTGAAPGETDATGGSESTTAPTNTNNQETTQIVTEGGDGFVTEGGDALIVGDMAVIPTDCGDRVVSEFEACDDGNNANNDGCPAACDFVEAGYVCPPDGGECQLADFCGDGRRTLTETCDDGNAEAGDGCSGTCATESGWACTTPGQPCVYTVACGDGVANGGEECDDLNTRGGDGCSETCTLESGWTCSVPGAACVENCGDGAAVGNETCDDGNTQAGDGCSSTCNLEPGFVCDAGGCRATLCGDGVKEGDEPCDDGNDLITGDGCSPGCRLEPNCDSADGTCTSNCGDGLLLPSDNEACDDGNDRDGDGCSSTCQVEEGFICDIVSEASSGVLELPIVYRDFIGVGDQSKPDEYMPDGHLDFENPRYSKEGGNQKDDLGAPGIVDVQLGADGKPVYAQGNNTFQTNGEVLFNEWYRPAASNKPILGSLLLFDNGDETFEYRSRFFFPIDGLGWVGSGDEPARLTDWFDQGCWSELSQEHINDVDPEDGDIDTHNFSFTSEVRYWFEFQGGEELVFQGDDDVWVFIKGRLVVDLGGVHIPRGGDVCGNTWLETEDPPACQGLNANTRDVEGQTLDLVEGNVYEAVVFQAERHTCQSNYRLTLSGFAQRKSVCGSVCGDGVVAGNERCDDGENNGAGYGFCKSDCTPGPRCGDAIVNGDEQCDNGLNLDGYYTGEGDCAPGCVYPPYCGDGQANPDFGEQCDLGTDGNTGAYDGCMPTCVLGPRCGDGNPDTGLDAAGVPYEQCDDGNRTNNDGCDVACNKERMRIAR